jgi:glutamyl-tRNA synthetase
MLLYRRNFLNINIKFLSTSSGQKHNNPIVRVRYAPSPTGYLHLGGLRTALFNYALAKQARSKELLQTPRSAFILRIEDTDSARTISGSIPAMIKALEWCGLFFDEGPILSPLSSPLESTSRDEIEFKYKYKSKGNFGPYIQSERLSIYRNYVDQLITIGAAYPCFCSSKILAEKREARIKKGLPSLYDRSCHSLSHSERDLRIKNGESHVIRLYIPPHMPGTNSSDAVLTDQVLGLVRFSLVGIDDQVLLKSDGCPTYHLASVVDDHLMEITHVIRGQEWLSSTPKHLLLYSYFGWKVPLFSHVPLLLNASDRSKLSKRQGDVSVEDFKAAGYLPEALIHFVSHLGWTLPLSTSSSTTISSSLSTTVTPETFVKRDEFQTPVDVIKKRIDGNEIKNKEVQSTVGMIKKNSDKDKSLGENEKSNHVHNTSGLTSDLDGKILTLDDFVQHFSINTVNKGNAVVDRSRLDFINSLHLRARIKTLSTQYDGVYTDLEKTRNEELRETVYQLLDKALVLLNNDINDTTRLVKREESENSSRKQLLISVSSRERILPTRLDTLMLLVHERATVVPDLVPLILPYIVTEDEFEKVLFDKNTFEAAIKVAKQVMGKEGGGGGDGTSASLYTILVQPLEKQLVCVLKEWKNISSDVDFSTRGVEVIKRVAKEMEIKMSSLMMTMRVLLTGKAEGVALGDIIKTLGKEKVIKRLEKSLKGEWIG